MIKKTVIAIAVSALASIAFASGASAAKHHTKQQAKSATPSPAAQAETIPGVNPMTNAAPIPPAEHPQSFNPVPGVNPM
jgi:hypothetical protein